MCDMLWENEFLRWLNQVFRGGEFSFANYANAYMILWTCYQGWWVTLSKKRAGTYIAGVISAALWNIRTKRSWLNWETDWDTHRGPECTKPTCNAEWNSGQYGQHGSRENQPDQKQAQRVEEQASPEKPVDQGPGSAGRGHYGAGVTPGLDIVLLKAVLLTKQSHTLGTLPSVTEESGGS